MATPRARDVRRYLDTLDSLGLVDTLADVRAAMGRAEQFARGHRTGGEAYKAGIARLAAALADGDTDIETAMDGAVKLQVSQARDGAAAEVLRVAASRASSLAGSLFAAYGDRLVTEIARPVVDVIVTEATKLAPKVAGITTDEEAMAAPKATRDAWARLGELEERRFAVVRLVDHLRFDGIVPGVNLCRPHHFHYRREPTTYRRDRAVPALPVRMLTALESEPHEATADEVAERLRGEAKYQQTPQQSARPTQPAATFV